MKPETIDALEKMPKYKRIQLPCGASATVTEDIKPETIKALDEMVRTAMRNVGCRTALENERKESKK